jgi:hypothetical protein
MTSHRGIITTATLVVLAVSGATAGVAQAGSLLSGYGGPGQGNQAILGAALLGGGGSSAGKGEGGGGSSNGSGAGTSATGGGAVGGAVGETTQKPVNGTRHGSARHATGSASGTSAGRPRPYSYPTAPGAPEAAVSSTAFGLSGSDALYILMVLAGLALAAGLTRQLVVHGPGERGRPD